MPFASVQICEDAPMQLESAASTEAPKEYL